MTFSWRQLCGTFVPLDGACVCACVCMCVVRVLLMEYTNNLRGSISRCFTKMPIKLVIAVLGSLQILITRNFSFQN